jgi:hypothetical protein
MSRYGKQESYGFHCVKIGEDDYRISWTWDRYYSDSRLRFPQTRSIRTDEKGAKRFCKKHDIRFPESAVI